MDVHFYENQTGLNFTMDVGCWDTVLKIKRNIEKSQGIPVAKQTLKHKGRVLLDDQFLETNHLELVIAPEPLEPPEPPPATFSSDEDDDLFDLDIDRFELPAAPPPPEDMMMLQTAVAAIMPPPPLMSTAPPATKRSWGIDPYKPTTMLAPLSMSGQTPLFPLDGNPYLRNILPPPYPSTGAASASASDSEDG